MKDAIIGILVLLGETVVVVFLLGLPVMLLWNAVMPTIFGLIKITFWQAVGLNLLSAFLLRSSCRGGSK